MFSHCLKLVLCCCYIFVVPFLLKEVHEKIQKFLNLLFHRLLHKKWFYILISVNNDTWPLFFMYHIIISFKFCYPLSSIFRKSFLVFAIRLTPFFYFIQKKFDIFHKHTEAFCFSFLQKDFNTFREHLFQAFLCFSDNIQLAIFIYIWKKYFIDFLSGLKIIFIWTTCFLSYLKITWCG